MERIFKYYGEVVVRFLKIYTLTLVLIYANVCGCQEQQKDNPAEKGGVELKFTYYKGGATETESEYVNGVRHGYRKFFSEDGKLESVSNYVNGKREGAMKSFYPDGSLRMSGMFINDRLDGEVISYYPNGKLESKKIYENGRMISNAHYTVEGKLEYEDKF